MDIQELCKYWQKELRLEDWDLSAKVLSDSAYELVEESEGIPKLSSAALNSISTDRKDAAIYIKESNTEKELYLLHELAHMLINSMDECNTHIIGHVPNTVLRRYMVSKSNEALEHSVWNVARALYNMKRGADAD